MGTTVSLLLPERHSASGLAVVRALFAEWERCLSRFLPASELSQFNTRAGQCVQVSGLLYTVLTSALQAARASHGLFDPTLLNELRAIGYDRTFGEIPASVPEAATPPVPRPGRWREIQVDPHQRHVTLPADVALDFGGIAKGMAVDAAIERLRQLSVGSAVVNAGGDLRVLGLPPDGAAWPVSVAGKDTTWTIPLRCGALATSGIARRRWRQGPHERHHLLDPCTGLPAAADLWSVSVAADRCEQAEVAAKVAFVLGSAPGAAFLRTHRLAGLLVARDGSWQTVDPWPEDMMPGGATADNASQSPAGAEATP
jgi:thiamine biosynthesis lipoprotein